MTRQQELELLAEWLGLEAVGHTDSGLLLFGIQEPWNPSPEGNDTDFLNMVAGRVDIRWFDTCVRAEIFSIEMEHTEAFADYNNDKLAAMKHAAYQVCLMAAREWREETNGTDN